MSMQEGDRLGEKKEENSAPESRGPVFWYPTPPCTLYLLGELAPLPRYVVGFGGSRSPKGEGGFLVIVGGGPKRAGGGGDGA